LLNYNPDLPRVLQYHNFRGRRFTGLSDTFTIHIKGFTEAKKLEIANKGEASED
jgi:hypothetical protein